MTDAFTSLAAALADRYRIERELGEGGMATVYLARDLKHDRDVAVKVLREDLAASLGGGRFLREIKIAARLQHPNILPLLDSGEADGFLFFVMPYVEGQSLRERLRREGELPVSEAVRLAVEIVDALAYAHGQGVVHRDIKPDNVMLSGRHALVTDFGVAKAVSEATGRTTVTTVGVALGTPAYMSPEQATASPHVDQRSDIYAVGVLAYELLTGRPPFAGHTPQQLLAAHVSQEPEPVSRLRPAVSEALDAVILKCLAKRPADRWQTAGELLARLEPFATPSVGITPTETRPAETPGRGRRRAALAGASVLGLALLLWAVWGRGRIGAGAEGAAGLDSLRVVVVPLQNRTGNEAEDAWGEVIAEGAARLLVQRATYLRVPAQAEVRAAGLPDDANPATVGRRFHARYVLEGRYAQIGQHVRFDAELSDVISGEQAVAIDPVLGKPDSIQSTLDVVAERAAVAAAAYMRPHQGVTGLRGWHMPSSFETLDLYTTAQDAFCRDKYSDALSGFEAIIKQDPAFTYARVQGLIAYDNGGRASLSRDSLQVLVAEAVPRMTQYERLYEDWLTAANGNWSEALRAAQALDRVGFPFAPFMTTSAALRLNRIAVAEKAAKRIPYRDPCGRQWIAGWRAIMDVNHLAGNYDAELRLAREAVQRFPGNAEFMGRLGAAGAALGNMAVVDSATDMLEATSADAYGVAHALVEVGNELLVHRHPDAAKPVYERAYRLAIARTPEHNIVRAEAALGALSPSEALPVLRAAADAFPASAAVGYLAVGLEHLGRSTEADSLVGRIWQLAPKSQWPAAVAAAHSDGRGAADALRRALNAGAGYYWESAGYTFLHDMPEFMAIRDDPAWRAIMTPRE